MFGPFELAVGKPKGGTSKPYKQISPVSQVFCTLLSQNASVRESRTWKPGDTKEYSDRRASFGWNIRKEELLDLESKM
jgi:hypothetical protein